MSRGQDSLSHRVVEQGDGGFAVHIESRNGTKIVPGFPTAEQAQEWIRAELDRLSGERTAADEHGHS